VRGFLRFFSFGGHAHILVHHNTTTATIACRVKLWAWLSNSKANRLKKTLLYFLIQTTKQIKTPMEQRTNSGLYRLVGNVLGGSFFNTKDQEPPASRSAGALSEEGEAKTGDCAKSKRRTFEIKNAGTGNSSSPTQTILNVNSTIRNMNRNLERLGSRTAVSSPLQAGIRTVNKQLEHISRSFEDGSGAVVETGVSCGKAEKQPDSDPSVTPKVNHKDLPELKQRAHALQVM
jgi:hypothetical protein